VSWNGRRSWGWFRTGSVCGSRCGICSLWLVVIRVIRVSVAVTVGVGMQISTWFMIFIDYYVAFVNLDMII